MIMQDIKITNRKDVVMFVSHLIEVVSVVANSSTIIENSNTAVFPHPTLPYVKLMAMVMVIVTRVS